MLQYRAIYPQTLELLKQLMNLEELKDFYLAGGTALALQIGHRISVDLDFFTQSDFSPVKLQHSIAEEISIKTFSIEENTLILSVIYPTK